MPERGACLFCDIVRGVEPAEVLYADDMVVAIRPPERQARVHLLILPREHIPSVDALTPAQSNLWWRLLQVAQHLASQEGIEIDREGYYLTTNAGRHHERLFPHLHLHLASGALE